jgi:SAM-dependent methyltransferase
VTATDPAEAQLRSAMAHERVTYKVAPAEQTDLASASVDLITVAQALHWFDFERFYGEVLRVMKPGGVMAAWGYGLHRISADVDPLLQHYYSDVVGPYWPPERQHIDARYRSIPFPFPEIEAPAFAMETEWTLDELMGYLGTWSATQRYVQAQGHDPLPSLRERLQSLWGAPPLARRVSWPIYFRVGTIEHQ